MKKMIVAMATGLLLIQQSASASCLDHIESRVSDYWNHENPYLGMYGSMFVTAGGLGFLGGGLKDHNSREMVAGGALLLLAATIPATSGARPSGFQVF